MSTDADVVVPPQHPLVPQQPVATAPDAISPYTFRTAVRTASASFVCIMSS
jgi:hypothetical protein